MANEKRLIDADATNADSSETTKIKTHFARIIVGGTTEKPYYNILYFNPTDKEYHIGFGSYCLEYVFKWLAEEFEIEDALTVDAVKVVRCKDCKRWHRDTVSCDFMRYAQSAYNPNWYEEDFCSYGERKDAR